MIKYIVSDMDGTLLGKNHDISEENLKAIRKAEEMGVHFSIATGRAYVDVKPFLDKYNLKCECIVLNGAEYRDKNGNVLEGIYIDKNKLKDILNIMNSDGLTVEIYTDKGFYTTNTKEEILTGMAYRVQTFNPEIISHEEALKLAREHPHFISMNYITDIDTFINSDVKIGKFIAFHNTEEKIVKLKEKLEAIENLAVSSSFVTNVEVNDIGAQKGIILSKVVKKMGINKEDVIVIGDSFNDYSMFKEFPNSFAMGNAIPKVMEKAKYVTDTNDQHGVAKAIYKALENNL